MFVWDPGGWFFDGFVVAVLQRACWRELWWVGELEKTKCLKQGQHKNSRVATGTLPILPIEQMLTSESSGGKL